VAVSADAVRCPSSRSLAQAALQVSPKEWWRTFVEGHNNYYRRAHRHLRSTGSE